MRSTPIRSGIVAATGGVSEQEPASLRPRTSSAGGTCPRPSPWARSASCSRCCYSALLQSTRDDVTAVDTSAQIWLEAKRSEGHQGRQVGATSGSAHNTGIDHAVVVGRGGGHQMIWIVENDQDLREMESLILESNGYEVEALGSAGEALARILVGETPDIVVSDWLMLDAGALIEQLRVRTIAFLLVTGSTGTPPGLPVLRKPFAVEALLRAVRAALGVKGR
jgi:CheY-like chemotaxis protein